MVAGLIGVRRANYSFRAMSDQHYRPRLRGGCGALAPSFGSVLICRRRGNESLDNYFLQP
jgi:hypothetical protein